MPWTRYLSRLFTVAVVIIGATQLVACNTVEGAGKDIETGGEKLQDVAEDVKN